MARRRGSAMALKASEVVAALAMGANIFLYRNMSSTFLRLFGQSPRPQTEGDFLMKIADNGAPAPPDFIAFGVLVCFAAFLLAWPGTALDRLWAINPRAHAELSSLGKWVAIAFLLLAVVAVYTAVLWFRRRVLGWRLAVVAIAVQVVGNLVNIVRGDLLRGVVGLAIAALLLFYLLSRAVKAAFRAAHDSDA